MSLGVSGLGFIGHGQPPAQSIAVRIDKPGSTYDLYVVKAAYIGGNLEVSKINGIDMADFNFQPPSRLTVCAGATALPTTSPTSLDKDEHTPDPDPIIEVNVAQRFFYTRASNLKRLDYFNNVFKYNPSLTKTAMIDRDPDLFALILRFLRCGLTYDQYVKGWCANDRVLFDNELLFYGVEQVEPV